MYSFQAQFYQTQHQSKNSHCDKKVWQNKTEKNRLYK